MSDMFTQVIGSARGTNTSQFTAEFFPLVEGDKVTQQERQTIETCLYALTNCRYIHWPSPNIVQATLTTPLTRSAGYLRAQLSFAFCGDSPWADCVRFEGVESLRYR
jgi:hypothetical protein